MRLATAAVVYLPGPASGRLARQQVAGRSLVLRMVVAAARGGVTLVGVPAALREAGLERALSRVDGIAGLVRWIDASGGDDPAFTDRPCLLLPASSLVDSRNVAALVESGEDPAGAVLAGSVADGAPVLRAPANLVAKLWHRLAAAEPIGDELALYVETARPAPVAAAGPVVTVRGEADLARAEALLYSAIGTDADSGVDTFLHRRCSIHITRLLVWTPITPNQVSLVSLAIGCAAIWAFWNATPASALVGVVLYAMACIADHSDGELARLTFQESAFGAHLDWAIDTIIHSMMVLAMAVSSGGPVVLTVGVVGALGVVLSALFARYLPREIEVGESVGGMLKNIGNRDLFYLLLLLFVLFLGLYPPLLPALVLVVAAGSQSYWIACLARIKRSRAPRA